MCSAKMIQLTCCWLGDHAEKLTRCIIDMWVVDLQFHQRKLSMRSKAILKLLIIANIEISLSVPPMWWCVKCGWLTILCMCSVRNDSITSCLVKETTLKLNLPAVLIMWIYGGYKISSKKMKHGKPSRSQY